MPTLGYLALTLPPAALCAYLLVSTLRGLCRLPRLADVVPDRATWPSVTIVTPACNEEHSVDAAMRSLLAVDYPDLRVIAVDDRSTDRTGALLDALATADPRVEAVHLDALPDGWLGKVHALARGTERAASEWLLFMDADAHLAPGALSRAVAHAESEALDLLTVVPTIHAAGLAGDAAFGLSLAILSAGGRLRRMGDPRHPEIVAATGAFILVRRSTFERTPGFAWLRLEVADDFGLALLVKRHGGRCAIVNGRDQVKLTWYASAREMAVAMQKNLFAILGRFSVARMAGLVAFFGWLAGFPLVSIAAPEPRFALAALPWIGLAAGCAAMALASRATGRRGIGNALLPVGALLYALMIARAAWVGRRVGGILWRGVLYPSSELARAQRVRI